MLDGSNGFVTLKGELQKQNIQKVIQYASSFQEVTFFRKRIQTFIIVKYYQASNCCCALKLKFMEFFDKKFYCHGLHKLIFPMSRIYQLNIITLKL